MPICLKGRLKKDTLRRLKKDTLPVLTADGDKIKKKLGAPQSRLLGACRVDAAEKAHRKFAWA
jgi:hypothetical protein